MISELRHLPFPRYSPVQLAHIYLDKRKKCDKAENCQICSEKCAEQHIKSPRKSEWCVSRHLGKMVAEIGSIADLRLYLANRKSHVEHPNTKSVVRLILHHKGPIHLP